MSLAMFKFVFSAMALTKFWFISIAVADYGRWLLLMT